MSDILILTHAEFCPPGHLGAVLAERGLDFRVIRADLGELAGLDAERPRAVAIMGGPMSVNDDLPWLRDELALLRRFIERRIPLIGHCLGGQLLARALGATVRHQPYTEMGWQPMQRESRDSPWLAGLPERFSIFQWHGDAFDLPQGAERLLSSPWCENQGFSWGDHVLGLQGHPEMTEELVRRWIAGWPHLLDPSQPSQQSAEDMLAGLPAKVAGLNRAAEGFYRHWLSLID
ncbi:type 1 glutamine amidotransferase [Pseudomonas aeruginosa]|uniref:type 1 glutamine amidotransferase n=1 Tax=Pseudomonas aeruginosa TaxID=287 RepID=UPI000E30F24D|nr:type 1 glutamine amidotransferase [Pseudomonas aeruginosa]EKY1813319.1 gamma-glutamyl-gamma-aminobutyrate hydrolase family protein [Pseudomonas aeruginosa]MBG5007454.1 gamma-glutamyl-gamma-aminobutyrate hydrolase family protein [Pseudomonas aeruginosa]MBG5016124.1 gamma-glutamyl-gamma-aminobutyrate hydrolase family protein [Pseudomonas aeruginosa]MBG5035129.1 gamma-glutamyl-gamma-aminobutyrate hydrolase family protein [Pseudomonas aeruginosa]MBI6968188.1 gamma-glutamyl-gamma-aminobutyrate h